MDRGCGKRAGSEIVLDGGQEGCRRRHGSGLRRALLRSGLRVLVDARVVVDVLNPCQIPPVARRSPRDTRVRVAVSEPICGRPRRVSCVVVQHEVTISHVRPERAVRQSDQDVPYAATYEGVTLASESGAVWSRPCREIDVVLGQRPTCPIRRDTTRAAVDQCKRWLIPLPCRWQIESVGVDGRAIVSNGLCRQSSSRAHESNDDGLTHGRHLYESHVPTPCSSGVLGTTNLRGRQDA